MYFEKNSLEAVFYLYIGIYVIKNHWSLLEWQESNYVPKLSKFTDYVPLQNVLIQ